MFYHLYFFYIIIFFFNSHEKSNTHHLEEPPKYPHELKAIHIISFRHLSCKFGFVLKKNDILCFQNYFGLYGDFSYGTEFANL